MTCVVHQESQVSVEVAIPQRYHRAIMGPKGCRIQHITREHEVQIKFPERDDGAAGEPAGGGGEAVAADQGVELNREFQSQVKRLRHMKTGR